MEDQDKWLKAGQVTGQVLNYGKTLIKVGASVLDVTEKIEAKIKELGASCAFPINISINEVAAHYTAFINDKKVFSENDIVKLDVGCHIDGFLGDSAVTIDLTGSNKELSDASKEGLKAAIKEVFPGNQISKIGLAIEETIQSHGFEPIRNLSGHRVERYNLHAGINIPNYDTKETHEIEEDDIFAIEPFATNGRGLIYESGNPNIFSLIQARPVRMQSTRQILQHCVKEFKSLPFTPRWLPQTMAPIKISFALKQLLNQNIIKSYAPLVEKAKGLVSQHEHTVIVKDKVIVTTKVDED